MGFPAASVVRTSVTWAVLISPVRLSVPVSTVWRRPRYVAWSFSLHWLQLYFRTPLTTDRFIPECPRFISHHPWYLSQS